MEAIFYKMTPKRALAYIDFVFDKRIPDQPLLEIFLNKLIKDRIFTQESLNKLIEEELNKPSVSLANLDTIMSRSSLERDSDFADMNLLKEKDNDMIVKETIEGKAEKFLKAPTGTQDLLWKNFTDYSYKQENIGNECLQKDSKAVSELIVSSYSVASNYLNDSDTEQTENEKEPEQEQEHSCNSVKKSEENKLEPELKIYDEKHEEKNDK